MAARCAWETGIGVGGARNEYEAHKPVWPPCRDDLRHLAAHRMADQHVANEPESTCNSLGVVSHRAKIVSSISRNGVAPTTLVECDRARLAAELVNHVLPSA